MRVRSMGGYDRVINAKFTVLSDSTDLVKWVPKRRFAFNMSRKAGIMAGVVAGTVGLGAGMFSRRRRQTELER